MFGFSGSSTRKSLRNTSLVAVLGLVGGLTALPGAANAGFFEQLFGVQQAPQAAPAQTYAPSRADRADDRESATRHHVVMLRRAPVHKHVAMAAKSDKADKQSPSDLMHDATLRQGDAVMMRDGLHVYAGEHGSKHAAGHSAGDFVLLDQSDLSKKKRDVLASVDAKFVTVADTGETLASGRSAAVGEPISPGVMVKDVSGKSVRYVGP